MVRKDTGVKLGRSTARRLLDAGRYVEQQPRNAVPAPSGPVDFAGATVLLTTTVITRATVASTSLTPGTGSAKVQKWDGAKFVDAGLPAYPILNTTTSQIASGAFVTCVPLKGQFVIINPAQCSDLS